MRAQGQGLRVLALTSCMLAASSCATLDNGVVRPVKYRLAGTDVQRRANLEQGLAQLKRENYEDALMSLNRAIWDLERIEKRRLRLEDLAEVYQALADVYSGLRKSNWADEHRSLSAALAAQAPRDAGSGVPERALTRAREAYTAAQFREAVVGFGQALVDLEGLTHTAARLNLLEEARCYLAFSYFALDQASRAREELQRLWALDASLAFCTREAPPALHHLISEVQQKSSPQ